MSLELRRQRQKDFIRIFNTLVGRYAPWQIWCDFVQMYAIAIANSAPIAPYREKREKMYLDIVKKYRREEIDIFVQMCTALVNTMDISVGDEGDYGDFLGELFMALNLGNNLGGQFFTPYDVCRMMAEATWNDSLTEKIERDGYISANDPACGAGATLIAFAQVCREHEINYQRHVLFTGQDIDSTTALMCYIQLSLLGCAGYVHIGNTLTEPMQGHTLFGDLGENTWYTPLYWADIWTGRKIVARLRMEGKRHERAAQPVATPLPEPEALSPIVDMPEAERQSETQSESTGTTLTVSDSSGQIMFDFG